MVFVKLKFNIPKEKPYERHIWQYDKADFIGFRKALTEYNFDACFEGDIDTACQRWTDTILSIARTYIPNKVVLIRPNDSPWYGNELRKMKRKLNRLFKKFKKNKTDETWEAYKQFRNQYQQKLTESETGYRKKLHDSLSSAKNVKKWWSTVKDILGKGNDTSYPTLVNGNDYFETSEEKANHFNEFFLSHNNIDTSNASLPKMPENNMEGLSAIDVTENEILDLLKCLDTNKATGPDGISPKLLKEAGIAIVPSLTRLIKMSLNHSKTPILWKRAHVLPLFKKA